MNRRLCIIPARGGSKRIPRKNIKNFLGKPIISYVIENSVKSNLFDKIIVSTDDHEIKRISEELGAEVPFMRSKKNSDDFSTTTDVIHEVLEKHESIGETYKYVCCIYPTAVFANPVHIKNGFTRLIKSNCISVFPVVKFSYPIWRGLRTDINNKTKMIWPQNLKARSQDLEQVYHDAGQWYWFDNEKIDYEIFSEDSETILLNEFEVQDIDNYDDWKMAEMKYKILYPNII